MPKSFVSTTTLSLSAFHSFIHSFIKYSLSKDNVSGTVSALEILVMKTDKVPAFMALMVTSKK